MDTDTSFHELKSLMPSTIVVCSNQQVFDLYGDYIISGQIDATIHTWLFPDGEEFKNLETVVCAINGLTLGLDRRSVLIALGGGVVGDLTGFVALDVARSIMDSMSNNTVGNGGLVCWW